MLDKKGAIISLVLIIIVLTLYSFRYDVEAVIRPCVDGDVGYYICTGGTQVIESVCKNRKWALSNEKCLKSTPSPITTLAPTTTPQVTPHIIGDIQTSDKGSTSTQESPYIEFIEHKLPSDVSNRGMIIGKIRNMWDKGFDNIQVQAIIYDKYNSEIEIGNTYTLGVLESNEIHESKVSLNDLVEDIDNYKLTPLTKSEEFRTSEETIVITEDFEVEKEIFEQINDIRQSNGLNRLIWNDKLALAGRDFLKYMSENAFFCHVDPTGMITVETYALKYGITSSIAENLVGCFDACYDWDSSKVIDMWMESPGHRYNLLYPGHTHGAIAIYSPNSINHYVSFEALGTGVWDYSVYVEGFKNGLSCEQVADRINAQVT